MRWATRAGVHIDRAACTWLIRRAVDPGAEFVLVAGPHDVPADAPPRSAGSDLALRGLSMVADDERVPELSGPLLDGAHEFFRRELLPGREPA
ncbi:chromate resistance protein ChrB domain-containing protein [Cellulomonas endophytica]|uniref:chromate resistance protein ChrB domain-containing protein n=1 Tax=Cellulomonas endophytica TaxID=2494735 RepID=UPI0010130D29|nr:chromate resistance protein ChrB domain-containing protein [Cellulomonas endophytica]